MAPPICSREEDALVFTSQPPQKRAFRVLLSPRIQADAPLMVSVSTADVYPGQSTPCHTHDVEHEAWYCVSGRGVVVVGESCVDAWPGTVVVAPPGVPHQLVNLSAGENFKCVVVFSPAGPEAAFMPPGDPGE